MPPSSSYTTPRRPPKKATATYKLKEAVFLTPSSTNLPATLYYYVMHRYFLLFRACGRVTVCVRASVRPGARVRVRVRARIRVPYVRVSMCARANGCAGACEMENKRNEYSPLKYFVCSRNEEYSQRPNCKDTLIMERCPSSRLCDDFTHIALL
jgi:hypothetical protein